MTTVALAAGNPAPTASALIAAWLFAGVSLLMLGTALRLLYLAWRRRRDGRVLGRLMAGQPQLLAPTPGWARFERTLLRAGLGKLGDRSGAWLVAWGVGIVAGLLLGGWLGLLLMLSLPPVCLRLYIGWHYQRRVGRMIAQLPPFLDHAVRSLKAGRSLADAVLNGIESSSDPLQGAMLRVRRNVQLGVSLPDALHDLAELYEQDELRILALGLRVNHRYGGNASELLENLMRMIREREQAARQLSAMTGETRLTAFVLAGLPVALVTYFLITNPNYLMNMWRDSGGQNLLLIALGLQVLGCLSLWRMLRSV